MLITPYPSPSATFLQPLHSYMKLSCAKMEEERRVEEQTVCTPSPDLKSCAHHRQLLLCRQHEAPPPVTKGVAKWLIRKMKYKERSYMVDLEPW
ncbi:hypothetical protein RIF29_29661 [Crotalaria pallida]|uniref:Uncharacterized protein n=1 Tax=Crotalaria pallida TaxID=3830 RepID=A0AAN9HU40_CROPI